MTFFSGENMTGGYGGADIINSCTITVNRGEIVAILGPNGAGKSTLLNCFVGKLIPDTGTVMFNGQSLLGIKPHEINQLGVSRVFQTPEIFSELSVWENTLIPCFAKRDGSFTLNALGRVSDNKDMAEKAEKMLVDVDLINKKDMLASSMSRGDKRRLEMAMCLSQNPKLLLLDEPTAGMARADTESTIELLKSIQKKLKITMAIIEHDMGVVFSLAQKISVLAQGTVIVEDIPEKIKGHPKVKEAYLGEAQVEGNMRDD